MTSTVYCVIISLVYLTWRIVFFCICQKIGSKHFTKKQRLLTTIFHGVLFYHNREFCPFLLTSDYDNAANSCS